jgi:hypothetical protein
MSNGDDSRVSGFRGGGEGHAHRRDRHSTLRLEIDGKWTASEVVRLISTVEELYDLRLVLTHREEKTPTEPDRADTIARFLAFEKGRADFYGFDSEFLEETSTLGRIVQDEGEDYRFRFPVMLPAEVGFVPLQLFVPPRARLTVKALRYGSKGATDLTGFAAALRTIERFLSGIIKLVATRTERKLADERRTLENEALRQKIDADRPCVRRSMPIGETENRNSVLES